MGPSWTPKPSAIIVTNTGRFQRQDSMMDAFSTVLGVLQIIQKAGTNLERARRVGKTVKALRFTFNRLLELQDDVEPERDRDLLLEITDLANETMELIQTNSQRKRVAMTFFWNSQLDSDVMRINTSLSVIYGSLAHRIERDRRSSSSRVDSIGRLSPELVPRQTKDDELIPRIFELSPRLAPRRPERRESMVAPSVPCKLTLKDAEGVLIRPPIPLSRLSIIEKNEMSRFRILQYEDVDHAIVVTHEIPYGKIPCTPNTIDATQVCYLDDHYVTIETENEYAMFVLRPIYDFDTVDDCHNFMNMARDRTLLARYIPKEITSTGPVGGKGFIDRVFGRDPIRARNKVVMLWERTDARLGREVTLTFHDRQKPGMRQWSIDMFAENPMSSDGGKCVQLSTMDHGEQFHFTFRSKEDADGFKTALAKRRRSSAASHSPSFKIPRRPVASPK